MKKEIINKYEKKYEVTLNVIFKRPFDYGTLIAFIIPHCNDIIRYNHDHGISECHFIHFMNNNDTSLSTKRTITIHNEYKNIFLRDVKKEIYAKNQKNEYIPREDYDVYVSMDKLN